MGNASYRKNKKRGMYPRIYSPAYYPYFYYVDPVYYYNYGIYNSHNGISIRIYLMH